MGRTTRRTSYRRSKRWNPSRYQSEAQATAETRRYVRGHRNPTFTRYLGDGSKVSVSDDGQVVVSDRGGVFSRYRIGRARLAHFIRDLQKPANRSDKYDYQGESLQSEGSYSVQLNPGRRGRKSRRNPRRISKRGGGQWAMGKGSGHHRRTHRMIPGQKRTAHHFGGGVELGRIGHKRKNRKNRRKNPRIKRREARTISRVLKRHGYRCAGKRRRTSRRRR